MHRWDEKEGVSFYDCFVCKQPFRYGPHRYDGKHIGPWAEVVCDRCCASNWDGIVPGNRPHVIPALEAKGIKIELNENGWLDIPGVTPKFSSR